MVVEILDSETFQYYSNDSHQGRHTILKKLLPGLPLSELGQVLITVQDDTHYLWVGDGEKIRWTEWRQWDYDSIEEKYLEEEATLTHIELGHDGFKGTSTLAYAELGSEIEIIPRRCEEIGNYEKWTVDLIFPGKSSETAIFHVYGKERIRWFNERAILDENMIIALRNFQFQEVVV